MKTWLVTGCSSGLGRAIAEEALATGNRVVATARDPSVLADLSRSHPETALTCALDVTDGRSVTAAIEEAEACSGNLDVLVCNAAYGLYGTVEEVSEGEAMRLFQTNFFGVVRTVRAALPGMRRRRSGTLVIVGSIAGLVGGPGNGFYCATKFALEGLSEALRAELEPLGIRLLLLEASGIRTDFHDRSYRRAEMRIKDYEETAGGQIRRYLGQAGRQPGDPRRIARLLCELVSRNEIPFRLPLGKSAVDRAREKMRATLDQISEWEETSRSTDFDA